MKAAAYALVSTGKQDLQVQLDEIRHFATRKSWSLIATYSESPVQIEGPQPPKSTRLTFEVDVV